MNSPSSQERNEADLLLAEATELACEFLSSSGEFYPFAVAFDATDQVRHVQVYAGESPSLADVRDQLLQGLRRGIASEGYRAVAIVRNVRVADTETGLRTDAISVAIEHRLGHAVQCFVPYSLAESGQCETAPPKPPVASAPSSRHEHRQGPAWPGAVERGDAPIGALDLKMLHDDPSFINVRFAGDPACWAGNVRVEED